MDRLREFIRDVPDFPKPGIVFKDLTPLLADPAALALAVELMANPYRGRKIDLVVGAESRGFIFGTAIAQSLSAGFVPIRKPGKLPFDTHAFHYELEYGTDCLEIHIDGVTAGQNVLVVDDLLATGGTIEACCNLVEKLGANVVGCCFLIDLAFLNGASRIAPREVFSLLRYE